MFNAGHIYLLLFILNYLYETKCIGVHANHVILPRRQQSTTVRLMFHENLLKLYIKFQLFTPTNLSALAETLDKIETMHSYQYV